MDLIYREDAEALFRDARKELFNLRDKFKTAEEYDIRDNMLLNAEQMIHALPSVNPTKTGYWIDDNENEIDAQYGRHLYKCSECNEYADMFVGGTEDWWDLEKPNYCPNCGARMVESQERSE